ERFNQYTGGRDYWSRADIQDSDQLQRFDRMAQQLGITNGVISRQQYLDYYQQMGDRFGGTRSGGPPPMMSAPDGTSTLAPTAPGSSDGRGRPAWGTPEAAESMFRRLDKDGDGVLSNNEIPDSLRNERAKWDTNGDSFIDLSEFTRYMMERAQQMQAER